MKKLLLSTTLMTTLGACAQGNTEWICNEGAISWDKVGEPIEYDEYCYEYFVPPVIIPVEHDDDDGEPRVPNTPTSPPDGPEDEPETPSDDDEPKENPKDDDTPDDSGDDGTDVKDTPRGGPKGNNGHGSGDQAAPGNSGDNNNAENSDNSGRGNSGQGQGGHKGTPNNN